MKTLLPRVAAVGSLTALALLAAAPAWALDDGEPPHESTFTTLDALLVFVGIPVLAALVIALLVYAPHLARGPRYRPGRPYDAEPVWLGGPVDVAPALESGVASSTATDARGGGASAGW